MSVVWLTETEKVAILQRCGYPAYGYLATFDPFSLYFPAFRLPLPVIDDRMAAVLTTVRAKLAELTTLDTAIVGAGENLDTDQAAVWTRNRTEVADRQNLMNRRRKELCNLMGVQPGPYLSGGNSIRLVV